MYFLSSLLTEFITVFLFFPQIPRNNWLVKRGKHNLPHLLWVAKVRLKNGTSVVTSVFDVTTLEPRNDLT